MKRSELRQLIREEVQRLSESDTINISEIPNAINYDLEHDGDPSDLRLFISTDSRWAADNERDYKKIEKAFDKEFKGNGYVVYIGYDVSGYDYWMKQQEETNYAMITIRFDNAEFPVKNLKRLEKDIAKVDNYVKKVIDKYEWAYFIN